MRLPGFASKLINRLQVSETAVLIFIGIIVGLLTGLGVWLFKQLINLAHTFFYTDAGGLLARLGGWTIVLVPVIGGLVVGLIMQYLVGVELHHGVTGIIESVALGGGRLRYWRAPVKAIAAALSIGAGASVGPEDPSVQIGANLGSLFGDKLRMSEERVRALVASGAAAGIAAAFNAPIAGVFFAIEIIMGEIAAGALGVVVLASVTSAVVTQALSGPEPAFIIPPYTFGSPWQLGLYLVLGMLAGPISATYIRLLYIAQDAFHAWHVPRPVHTAAVGLLLGLVGLMVPQVLGVGYQTIGLVLSSSGFSLLMLVVLMTAKLIMTPMSIAGEFPGGVFAPSLFIGAMLGGAVGTLGNLLFPSLHIEPGAFAMVGMAAVLAGAVHAPLTAILLLFEMTRDYRIILPLMFAVTVSLLISTRLQPDSIYIFGLARKGLRIERGRDVEVLDGITVGEVMDKDFAMLKEDEPLTQASDRMLKLRRHGLMVVDKDGGLCGVLTLQDIQNAQTEHDLAQLKVQDAYSRDLVTAFPDDTLSTAFRRMGMRDIGRLPVVSRDDPRHVLGILRRSDTIRAYDLALTRRTALRHRAQQVRLGLLSGAQVQEIRVEPGASCAGKKVSEVGWPRDSVIASIRRGSRLLVPHGETVLQNNDVLTFVVEGNDINDIRLMCRRDGAQRS
jgi:chloride channel protein, CIC family